VAGKEGRGAKKEREREREGEEGYDLCLLPFTPRATVILYL